MVTMCRDHVVPIYSIVFFKVTDFGSQDARPDSDGNLGTPFIRYSPAVQ